MSDFKLEMVISRDFDEPESSSLNEKINGVDKILNVIDKQGEMLIGNFATNAEHRAIGDRGNQEAHSDSVSDSFDGDGKCEHGSGRKSGPLLSGTAYRISSCSMILLNKVVLSTYNFNAGISLVLYQNLICCLVVAVLGLWGAVLLEKCNWKLVRVWIPVNAIFVGMLVSGMYSNWGVMYLPETSESESMGWHVFDAVSRISDAMGYAWQIINCILTASYSLTLRQVMEKAKQLTRSGSLNEISMVLLNNLLSLPFAILLILLFDEWEYVINALVGSLNKIPISIAGLVLFRVPLSVPNLFSILFGLFAGIFFARAKMS